MELEDVKKGAVNNIFKSFVQAKQSHVGSMVGDSACGLSDDDLDPKFADALENERILKIHSTGPDRQFDLKKSSASCKISEIQQIIFGGLSSRFWMLRKHLNAMLKKDHITNKVPFYSWQCITL